MSGTQSKILGRFSSLVSKLGRISINNLPTTEIAPLTIETLPSEVLEIIFEAYFDIEAKPFEIMSVSRRWRAVVISNPRLWTCIRVVNEYRGSYHFPTIRKQKGMTGDVMIDGRWQICQTEERLMEALARSGTLPIRFAYSSQQYGRMGNPLVTLALAPPIAARLEVLSIEDRTRTMQEMTQQPVQRHLPHLREINFSGDNVEWAINFLKTLQHDGPITLSSVFGSWRYKSSFKAGIWAHVHYLSLAPQGMTADDLTPVITNCANLVKFRSMSRPWPRPWSNFDPNILAKVPEAFLSCVPRDLNKLNLQGLQKLEFEDSFEEERDTSSYDLQFPSLFSLKIYSQNSIRFFRHWHMPLLTTLDITHKGDGYSSEITFRAVTFPCVIDFRIATQESYRELGFIYGFVPNVQRLTFIELNRSYIFSDEDLLGEVSKLKDPEICPGLQTVTFGDAENRAQGLYSSFVGKQIGKIQRSRVKNGGSSIHFGVFMYRRRSERVELFQYAP